MLVTSSNGMSSISPQPMRHSMQARLKLGLVSSAVRSPCETTCSIMAWEPVRGRARMIESLRVGSTSRS